MPQFDVYRNPGRGAYPLIVDLQSDHVHGAPTRVVAPLVPRTKYTEPVVKLTPLVVAAGVEHVVLVPFLANVPAGMLSNIVGNIRSFRVELIAALDLLFTGS